MNEIIKKIKSFEHQLSIIHVTWNNHLAYATEINKIAYTTFQSQLPFSFLVRSKFDQPQCLCTEETIQYL